jgi:ankyrin repeat protein
MRTALHYAVDEGHARVVETLLDYGADPGVADGAGRNALHVAALRADEGITRLLLAAVKDPKRRAQLANARDQGDLTPAFLAHSARGADHGAFLALLESGAHWDE